MGSSLRHSAPSADHHQEKTWKDIAERISNEQDSEKLSQLTNELIDALDDRVKKGRAKPQPMDQEHGKKLA